MVISKSLKCVIRFEYFFFLLMSLLSRLKFLYTQSFHNPASDLFLEIVFKLFSLYLS